MNDLLNLLKGIAPTLATAVAGPLGGAAVTALAAKFGVSDSVESVAKAIAGDPAAAQKLQELEMEYAKLDAADRDSARKREAEIATSASAPWYSKVVTPLLAVGVFAFWGAVQWFLVNHIVPSEMREIVIRLLGQLDAAFMMVLTYYFGASHKH
jgi:pimeloyl-ACP methyl ester carboxylesterase